jgi:aminopeptidase
VDERFAALAELAVHGANLRPGQLLGVSALSGQEELARAIARAGYGRGARFVDVFYFDPYVKRARIELAGEDTLDYVPGWYADRLRELAAAGAARISMGGVVSPDALAGLDGTRLGRDRLPWLRESMQVINDRATNWCVVPCPTRDWASLVYGGDRDEAYGELWRQIWHVLRLDEPDPGAAWDARIGDLRSAAAALDARRFDTLELRGPGTELTVGLMPSSRWSAGELVTRDGIRHLPNLPTEEVFTTPDPLRADGHVTATRPLVLKDGVVVRGLRLRFEAGRAVEVDADENGEALRGMLAVDPGGTRLGEVALVDRHGRIGPLQTTFFDTLLDENAASHLALGAAYAFLVGEDERERINESVVHVDFMVGSDDVAVTGITGGGERVPVLRGGDWQL